MEKKAGLGALVLAENQEQGFGPAIQEKEDEDLRRIEAAKKRLSKYKVVTKVTTEDNSMKD